MCHVNKTTGRFPGNKKSDTMKPEDIYNGLEYTTREINRTFKIKVNGLFNGKKINTLVGVSGLIKLVGVEKNTGDGHCRDCNQVRRQS